MQSERFATELAETVTPIGLRRHGVLKVRGRGANSSVQWQTSRTGPLEGGDVPPPGPVNKRGAHYHWFFLSSSGLRFVFQVPPPPYMGLTPQ